jgi:hypothetical protein
LGVIITVSDAAALTNVSYFLRTAGAPPAAPTTTLVLGLKGMKVYPKPT